MDFDIIVIGSASMDVFVKTEARIVHIRGRSHGQWADEQLLAYPLGSKLLIEQLAFAPGGAGTNVCATFARLGFKTAFIGKIGADVHGRMLLDWLDDNAITFLGERGGQTGYSLILASQASDRTILSFKGCNNELESVWPSSACLPTRWLARSIHRPLSNCSTTLRKSSSSGALSMTSRPPNTIAMLWAWRNRRRRPWPRRL